MAEHEETGPSAVKPLPRTVTTRRSFLTVLIVSVITNIAVSIGCIAYYDRHYATKILVYDLLPKLQQYKMAASEGKITFQQADQGTALEIAEAKKIADSMPQNYIVVTGDAILGSHAQIIGQ